MMKTTHYLRFVQALALVSAPGCAGVTSPSPAPTQTAVTHASPSVVASSEAAVDAATPGDAALGVDAGYPQTSGPIVPPELPHGFA